MLVENGIWFTFIIQFGSNVEHEKDRAKQEEDKETKMVTNGWYALHFVQTNGNWLNKVNGISILLWNWIAYSKIIVFAYCTQWNGIYLKLLFIILLIPI